MTIFQVNVNAKGRASPEIYKTKFYISLELINSHTSVSLYNRFRQKEG